MNKIDFKKMDGLIPAIIQDEKTLQVLMIGFMNGEAYKKTLETGKVWFYSRTKKRLWMKGEESKNYLNLVNIVLDCDSDSLLVTANPSGPTCHTGSISCFESSSSSTISKLFQIISDRKESLPRGSYTSSLFKEGINKISAKVAEESGELIKAGLKESKQRVVEEASDLIYHMAVLLTERGVCFQEVESELKKRME